MTRDESLPLFYSRCQFTLGFESEFLAYIPSYTDHHACLFSQTNHFLQIITAQNLSCIKRLQVCTGEFHFHRSDYYITFDLNDNVDPDQVFWFRKELFSGVDDQESMAKVREWAGGVATREGPLKLVMTDITDLHNILRASF